MNNQKQTPTEGKLRKKSKVRLSKMIDMNRKRVFIENDYTCVWDEDEIAEIEQDMGFTFSEAFPLFIGEAVGKSEQVLKAIIECDDIFVDTSYVGDSADLFNKMLLACSKIGIRGKRIFNFHNSSSLHMDGINKELYWEIAKNNLFYYRHEYHPIKKMILSNACK